jgi:hypothetical protein
MANEPFGFFDAHRTLTERVRVDGVDHELPILVEFNLRTEQPSVQKMPVLRARPVNVPKQADQPPTIELL